MAEDEKIEKLQAQIIDVLNLQKELKEQQDKFKKDYDKEMGDYINKIDELKEDLDKNAVFTTPEEYEGIKQEISELKEEMKTVITPYNYSEIEITINDNKNQLNELKEVLREHFQEVIDATKRHLKELVDYRIGVDPDWNLFVVEQWKTIRHKQKLLAKLGAKDSIHNDPIIKKAQEKFQEIKDGSKSADSGGILGGAKKKRNIDLKADEEPSKESTLSTYPSKYNPKKERFETRKGDLYLKPEKEPPKDHKGGEKSVVDEVKREYEKGLKEGKWLEYPPKEPPLKSELDDMANITQIIEIYDNGHENVFYPNTHIIVEKADLEKLLYGNLDERLQLRKKYGEDKE